MRKIVLLVIYFFLFISTSHSQDWIRTFSDGGWVDVVWVIETYDKGYLLLNNENPPGYLWLIKTDINGNMLWNKKIGEGKYHIRFGNIEQTLDGGFVLAGDCGKYCSPVNYDPCVIKLDACGNLQWCTVTFDKKFVSVSKGTSHIIYLYKLNSDLNYDSVYTQQYIYDSLCPGGIVSDTINPNCDVIVGIDEPQEESVQSQLRVYPNPASSTITVEFPKYLKQVEKHSGMTTSSVFYHWGNTSLVVFNDQGKKIFEKEIPKSMTQLQLNISSWLQGVYLFTLTWNHKVISDAKVIVQ